MSHQIVSDIKLCRFPSGPPEHNPPPPLRVETVDCGDEAASWLSDFLGQPCRLIRQSPDFTRDMKKRPSGGISPARPDTYLFIHDLSVVLYLGNARSHFLPILPGCYGCDLAFPSAGHLQFVIFSCLCKLKASVYYVKENVKFRLMLCDIHTIYNDIYQ